MLRPLMLLLALAQAEPAPPNLSPQRPPSSQDPAPAEPQPVAPAATGPAEPAPPEATTPPAPDEPPPPAATVGFSVRLGVRLPDDDEDLPGSNGYALGVFIHQRYLRLGSLELGAGIDFAFERYSRSVALHSVVSPGVPPPAAVEQARQLSHSTFALVHPFAVRVGRVRPYIAPGVGFDIGYYTSDERAARGMDATVPDEARATRLLLRATAGVDVAFARGLGIGLRADYSHLINKPTVIRGETRSYRLFTDRAAFGLAFLYGF